MTTEPLLHPRDAGGPRVYAETLLMVGGVSAGALAASRVLPASAIDMLYLVPVMAAASLYGLRAGSFAAVASALTYNFFFTAPVHTFHIDDPGNVVTVLVLLGVALLTSQLAARLRAQARVAAARAKQNAALAAFARQLIGTRSEDELGQAICREVARQLEANVVLTAYDGQTFRLVAAHPALDRLPDLDRDAAIHAATNNRPAGRGTDVLQAADWSFYPLKGASGTVGALGLARDDGKEPVSTERQALLVSILAQAALAIERQRLAAEMHDVEQLREREQLRDALLSSVGHDLRTPLTAILGAAAELRGRAGDGDGDVLDTLEGEARRLDRYVTNLLGMARIEAGAIRLRVEPVDLIDAVTAAARDVQRGLTEHPFDIAVPVDLPLIHLDPQLFHHCLINLLDNAVRYTSCGTPITVVGERTTSGVTLSVLDEGPGLPAGGEARVFETFARLEGSDRKGGTGLGLAIVKGFAQAMGVEVTARNRADASGAAFTLHFPEKLLVAATDTEAAE